MLVDRVIVLKALLSIFDKIAGGVKTELLWDLKVYKDALTLEEGEFVVLSEDINSKFLLIGFEEIVEVEDQLRLVYDGFSYAWGRKVVRRGVLGSRGKMWRKGTLVIKWDKERKGDIWNWEEEFFLNTSEGVFLNRLMEQYGWSRLEWMNDQTFRLWSYLFALGEKVVFKRVYEALYFLFGSFFYGQAIVVEDVEFPYRVVVYLGVPRIYSDGAQDTVVGVIQEGNSPPEQIELRLQVNYDVPSYEFPRYFEHYDGIGLVPLHSWGWVSQGEFFEVLPGGSNLNVLYPPVENGDVGIDYPTELTFGLISGDEGQIYLGETIRFLYFLKFTGFSYSQANVGREEVGFSPGISYTEERFSNGEWLFYRHETGWYPNYTRQTDIFYLMFYSMVDIRPAGVNMLFLQVS